MSGPEGCAPLRCGGKRGERSEAGGRPDPPRWPSSIALGDLLPGTPGRATGLSLAAAEVSAGDLFVALPGSHTHGARFASAAVAAGAVAVLTDHVGAGLAGPLAVPVVVVDDPRAVMAELSARLAGRPADRLLMLGVTGTNGKTTVVFCLAAILAGLGLDAATIGTMGFLWRGRPLAVGTTTITTPESPHLQAGLGRLADGGCQAVAMEVSSHALALRRVDAIRFAAAGFTNLGSDHLEFHGSREEYYQAKARLFEPARTGRAVIHGDDPAGRRLAGWVRRQGGSVLTLGRGPADLRIVGEAPTGDGLTRVTVTAQDASYRFDLGLPGAHNVTDAVLALGLVRAAGLDPRPGLAALARVRVPGRLERVALPGEAPAVYVDFAHTAQAVSATLAALAESRRRDGGTGAGGGVTGVAGDAGRAGGGAASADGVSGRRSSGRLIAVLGAGGDRDPAKRGPMGAAAAAVADVVVVTDDNPRGEDRAVIRRAVQIVDGGDRRAAIRWALAYASPGDTVAVLGKGHETTVEVAGEFHDFSDAAVIAEEWDGLHG